LITDKPDALKRNKTDQDYQKIKNSGYDSDEEKENAHALFMDDLHIVRQTFINSIEE
jgi:ribonuclease HII